MQMGRLILSMYVSVDGFISGPNGELDMLPDTPDASDYSIDLLDSAAAILLGGVAYEVFESYWSSAAGDPATVPTDLPLAERINELPKFVFSRSLRGVNWNATIIGDDIANATGKLKTQHDGALVLFGGASVAQQLMRDGLIDEYQLLVCPIILGDGNPLFESPGSRTNLALLKTETLRPSGVALLTYEPAGE
jgi:dihydrofolate reductase